MASLQPPPDLLTPPGDLQPPGDLLTPPPDLLPPEGEQSLPRAMGAAAAQGALSGAGAIVKGAGAMTQGLGALVQSAPKSAAAFGEKQFDVMRRVDEGEKVAPEEDPLGYADASPEQRAEIRKHYESQMAAAPKPEETGLHRAGEALKGAGRAIGEAGGAVSAFGEQQFPIEAGQSDRLPVKVAKVAGGLPVYIGAAIAGGLPAVIGVAGTQAYGSAFEEAQKKGADEPTAHRAAVIAGLVNGGLMAVPVAQWMEAIPAGLKDTFLANAIELAKHGVTFTAVSQAQTLLDNLVAATNYDPERSIAEGVGQQMPEQFLAGALLPGAGMAWKTLRDPTARAVERGRARRHEAEVADMAARNRAAAPGFTEVETEEPAPAGGQGLLPPPDLVPPPAEPGPSPGGAPAGGGAAATPEPRAAGPGRQSRGIVPDGTRNILRGAGHTDDEIDQMSPLTAYNAAHEAERNTIVGAAATPGTVPETAGATPGQPPEENAVIGLKFPKGPSRRAQVVQYFDAGKSVRLRFDDGSTHDYLTSEVMRDRTEAPPPTGEVSAPIGNLGKPLSEAESFDIMRAAEEGALRPSRPAAPATLAPDMLAKLSQADALEHRAANDSSLTGEKRQDMYAAAQKLRRDAGASAEPQEFSDEELARTAARRSQAAQRQAAEAMPEAPYVPTRPMDLVEFLASQGGIRDEGGELKGMDADKWHLEKPFRRKLVNPKGLSYDEARERAQQAGYLPAEDPEMPPQAGTADMLDLLGENLRGTPVFAAHDQAQADAWHGRIEHEKETARAAAGPNEAQLAHEDLMAERAEREALQADHSPAEPDDTADHLETELDAWLRMAHPEVVVAMTQDGVDVGHEQARAEPAAPAGAAPSTGGTAVGREPEGARGPGEGRDLDHPPTAAGAVQVPAVRRFAEHVVRAAGPPRPGAPAIAGVPFQRPRATTKGTAENPVEVKTAHDVAIAEQHVEPEPSEAQKESGVYPKGHLTIHGLDFTIETAKGAVRSGIGADGKPWENVSPATYGYFKRTEGADGEHVDGYIGPHPENDRVYVVDQRDPKTGRFDEHKVIMGVLDRDEARELYVAGFSDGLGGARHRAIVGMSVADFKDWLKHGDTKAPVANFKPSQRTAGGVDIRENEQKNGFEIRFPSKPDQAAIEAVKAAGFRWSRPQKLWYAHRNEKTRAAVAKLRGVVSPTPEAARPPAVPPIAAAGSEAQKPKMERIADLEAERSAEARGERVAGAPAQSFVSIAAGQAPKFMTELTSEGRRQLAVAAGFPGAEALRISKMNWDALQRAPEITTRLDEQWKRGDIQARQEPSSIGKNAAGHDLSEDERGVRSYSANGIRRSEPVQIIPGRGVAIDKARRSAEFLTETERTPSAAELPASHRLADAIANRLQQGPLTSKLLQDLAEHEFGGTLAAGKFGRDDMYDALELGVNRFVQKHAKTLDPREDLHAATVSANLLNALKNNLPTQTVRAGEKETHQQFSTPPDYSYAVAWVARIGPHDRVIEPSAGTGSLAVHAMNAHPREVIVNEISAKRAALVQHLGPTRLFTEDAEQLHNILPDEVKPTVVVMNPPFSATAGRMGDKKLIDTGANHVEQALKRLEPGGRLVAIVGGGSSGPRASQGMGPDAPHFKDWWRRIGSQYNVRANIGVDGGVYAKYGTAFNTRLLVIDKTPPGLQPLVSGDVKTIPELLTRLQGIRDDRVPQAEQRPAEPRGEAVAASREGAAGPQPVVPVATDLVGIREGSAATGAGRARGSEDRGGTPARPEAQPRPAAAVAAEQSERPDLGGAKPNLAVGAVSVDDVGGGGTGGDGDLRGPDAGEPQLVRVDEAAANPEAGGEVTESVYEPYRPQRVSVAGAKEHPGELVQSAAMGSVMPPETKYVPKLPAALIKGGALSDAQLESILYAGHAHAEMLPAAEGAVAMRRGFFIGDGTGVGKGREVAGIILDNWNQGRRKSIWVSEKKQLINDARRDWRGLSQDPQHIFDIGKTKSGGALGVGKGVAFITYDTLKGSEKIGREEDKVVNGKLQKGKAIKGKSRVDQIVDWVGKDFDGVIAFDESHNMANAIAMKASRGLKEAAQKALAGIELQQRLPNARVIYVSATGATEVSNLAYAERLGLWGRGTAFPNREAFIHQIADGGIAAMELVARDMKAMGHYIARSLSYNGVEYNRLDHTLSPDQRQVYDKLAEAWQLVLNNIGKALEITGASENPRAKSAALSAFWGSHQRFFNQVLTAMQMPAVLESVGRDLREGRQAVLQLVNTNEASQARALAKIEDESELEDLDMTPRDQLMQMIEHSFPTTQQEQYVDENGQERWRPVMDSAGNLVENKEAVAIREQLLNELGSIRVPDGPLEMLLNHFGTDKVAEVTGRKQRVVRKEDDKGNVRSVIETRSGSANVVEADAFQNGKKPILVFSEAGGTGRSYHADKGAPSGKARRAHYLVQAGWRADKAIQGFGRTHRTNEESQPIYHLVTTDLKGQKRFISSIARRLAQLGALTKGERRTGDQGLFSARDNLESREASEGLYNFFRDLHRGAIPEVSLDDFQKQTGLNLIDKESGGLRKDLPDIPQFLNRLLSLRIDMQNRVFDEFDTRLGQAVERAAASGRLDTGVESIKADGIKKVGDDPVYTHPQSGAETRYVQLDVRNRNHPRDFESVASGARTAGDVPQHWVISPKNRIYAVTKAFSMTDEKGNVLEQVRITGPMDYRYVDRHKLEYSPAPNKWTRVDNAAAAKRHWDAQVAKIPEFTVDRTHLITGAVLPIWDRLKGSPKIYRLQTDAGEKMLGRVIPADHLEATLKALGAERLAVKDSPAQVVDRLLNGGRASLSNGWTVKASIVAGAPRLEILGPNYTHDAELKGDGVFSERIQYQTRYFIPTGAEAAKVLAKVTANRPITELAGGRTASLEAPKPAYEQPEPPFFSALTRAVENVRQPRAPAQQWLGILKGLPGIKEEEVAWSGVREWLAGQKGAVTKEAVLEHLRENEVRVSEVVRGGTVPKPAVDKIRDWLAKEFGTPDRNAEVDEKVLQDAAGGDAGAIGSLEGVGVPARLLQPIYDSIREGATKFGEHALAGGENYREMILTLPSRSPTEDDITIGKEPAGWQVFVRGKPYGVPQATRELAVSGSRLALKDSRFSNDFRSGHFDEPNVLAHVRMNDRTGPGGEKILHVEEIQSDWHQQGRKHGYAAPDTQVEKDARTSAYVALRDQLFEVLKSEGIATNLHHGSARRPDEITLHRWGSQGAEPMKVEQMSPASRVLWDRVMMANAYRAAHPMMLDSHGIPNAPFKTSWHELALKRAIRYAAEHGYDKLTWTTGEQQAERYDLSKHIQRLIYSDGELTAFNHDGKQVIQEPVAEKDLPDYIGKDAAEKLLAAPDIGTRVEDGKRVPWREISGLDLKVGGEGMRGFYDKMLPAAANKIGKPFGVKVSETTIDTGQEIGPGGVAMTPTTMTVDTGTQPRRGPVAVHSIDITPAMRASVLKGQALFEGKGEGKPGQIVDTLKGFNEFAFGNQQSYTPLSLNERAGAYVVERGKATGHEHLVAYSVPQDMVIASSTSGRPDQVDLSASLVERLESRSAMVVLHHNHPSSAGLSGTDFKILGFPGAHAIVAHTHIGTVAVAKLSPGMADYLRKQPTALRVNALYLLHQAAMDGVGSVMRKALAYRIVDLKDANSLNADIVSRVLDGAGVIDYFGNRDLSAIRDITYRQLALSGLRAVANEAQKLGIPLEERHGNLDYRPSAGLRPDSAIGLEEALGGPRGAAGQGRGVQPNDRRGGAPAGAEARGAQRLEEEPRRYAEEEGGAGPEGHDPIDEVAEQAGEALRGAPPGTYARTLERMLPDPRASLPEKVLGAFEQKVIMPRTLAATDWRSSRYLEQWRRRDARAGELIHRWSDASKDYYGLTAAQRRAMNAVKELDRLDERERLDDGRLIVARNDSHSDAELSRPGESVHLDAAGTRAYHHESALMREAWGEIMRGTSTKLGGDGITDPAVLRDRANTITETSLKKRLRNIADLMEAMEAQRRTGYSPLMRFGDYFIAVKHREGTEPDSLGGFPKVARFELLDSKTPFESLFGQNRKAGETPSTIVDRAREATGAVLRAPAALRHIATVKARLAELRARYPADQYTIEHGFLNRKPEQLRSLDIPAIEKLFMALSQRDSELFGPMVEKLREKMYEEMKAGFKRRARTVPGYSPDFDRARGSYLGWVANHVADLEHGEDIRRAQEQYIDGHPDKRVQQYWKGWTDYQNSPANEMARLRQFGFYWTLAGNPSSTLLIAAHGPMVGFSTLAAGVGPGAAGRALLPAYREVLAATRFDTQHGARLDLARLGRDAAEKALINDALSGGQIHAAGAQDIRGFAQGDIEALRPHLHAWQSALNIASSNITHADQMNRVAMLLGAYRMALDPAVRAQMIATWGNNQVLRQMLRTEGDTPQTLAKFMVDEGLFVWGKRNRAPWQRGALGTMLAQFRNFEINYISSLWKMMTRMGPEGRAAGLMMLAGLAVLGGISGLPLAQDLEKVLEGAYHLITGDDTSIRDKLYELAEDVGFSRIGAEMIMKGPSRSLFGIDLSSRMGFGDVASKNLSPIEAIGVVPSMIYGAITRAWTRYHHNQPLGAAAELMPAAIRNPFKGNVVQPREGVRTQYDTMVVPPAEIGAKERAAQTLGFQSAKTARAYEERERARQIRENALNQKRLLTDQAVGIEEKIKEATDAGDTIEIGKQTERLNKLFTDHPDVKISSEAVRKLMIQHMNPEGALQRATPKALREKTRNSPLVSP